LLDGRICVKDGASPALGAAIFWHGSPLASWPHTVESPAMEAFALRQPQAAQPWRDMQTEAADRTAEAVNYL
jgi:hypothetical protein